MNKLFFILFFLITQSSFAGAQTFSEWFQQKETQKKYSLQQIAALQMYVGYMEKGYTIAKEGLTAISDFKNGEFNLHKDYFNSLKEVNPVIKKSGKVAAILALQIKISLDGNEIYRQVKNSDSFTGEEINYLYWVFDRLLNDCTKALNELGSLITSGELEMTDGGRLERLDILYNQMQERYTFLGKFSGELKALATGRTEDLNETRVSRLINGIKKD